ncbi:MAG: hypothetical protein IT165_36390 [Bryobacterales bacterium]|nr:hypothetical protein [Bryobacterales bacterium]
MKRDPAKDIGMNPEIYSQISISRLTEEDHHRRSELWHVFEDFVIQSEEMYPGIREWLRQKVGPEL